MVVTNQQDIKQVQSTLNTNSHGGYKATGHKTSTVQSTLNTEVVRATVFYY